eukprot:jgi/Astpho2/4921/Aster-x1266
MADLGLRADKGHDMHRVSGANLDAASLDLLGPGGLLERVLSHLGIPEAEWPAVRRLPSSSVAIAEAVATHRAAVDHALKQLPQPSADSVALASRRGLTPTEKHQQAQEGRMEQEVSQAGDELDEDLEGDLQRMRLQEEQPAADPGTADLLGSEFTTSSAAESASAEPQTSAAEAVQGLRGGTDQLSASQLAARGRQEQQQAAVSAQAIAALSELLHACLGKSQMPTLQSPSQATSKPPQPRRKVLLWGLRQQRSAEAAELPAEEVQTQPQLRWFDARGRVAMKRVAQWLNVPWQVVAKYECLVAQEAEPPEVAAEDASKSQGTSWGRYAAIGAAAVGGGALLAVTGGLAAPAIAAVTGTAISTVGGSAAAATAVTGVMGSSVGAATIIGGFGAGGAYHVGGKMARRIGDVKEFGFRPLPEDGNFSSRFSATETSVAAEKEAQQDGPSTADAAASSPSSSPTKRAAPKEKSASWFGTSEGHQEGSPDTSSSNSSWLPWGRRTTEDKEAASEPPLLPIPVTAQRRPDPRLALTVGVAGWIAKPSDFVDVWRPLAAADAERFCLVWETKELVALNKTLITFLKNKAMMEAGKLIVEHLVVQGLVAAFALPMTLLGASDIIDAQWSVCLNRAEKAGKLLAHVLMSGAHGDK